MTTDILWKLAGSLWMLIFSSLTFNKIGEVTLAGLLVMPETLIFWIFGIMHGFLASDRTFGTNNTLAEKILRFISDSILYSTFYRLVLLPACGFGYIEWTIVLLFLVEEFGIHFHAKLRFVDKNLNPFQLTILGLMLWGVKIIVRYALPQNLYQSLSENKTVLNLILVLVVLVGVYGIKRLFDLSKSKKTSKKRKSVTKAIGTVLKSVGTAILSVISGPAAIVVILILAVIFALGGFFFFNKVRLDLLFFIGGILDKALSTDNAGYTETNLNTIGQCLSIMIFFIVQIVENHFQNLKIEGILNKPKLEAKCS